MRKKGQFQPGNPGRPKGALGKKRVPLELKKQFCDLLRENLENLSKDLNQLPAEKRLDILCRLAPYILGEEVIK